MTYETVTVTVPRAKVPDLMQHVADLNMPEAGIGFSKQDILNAYYRGDSDLWRAFIDYLCDRPDEWCSTDLICKRLARVSGREMTRDSIAGMLGGNARGGPRRKIYGTKRIGGVMHYKVTEHVADAIKRDR